ncbi:MAG: NUDIX domain-containing protein [Bacteroidales bacterium]|nr:NUDIX domain-containing protein [Bacteroidales bacterium]
MLPVVEENGLVIGQTPRKLVHSGVKLLHPVVHLHIINRSAELFLQRRSMSKELLPGKWDTAVGGHVGYGELLEVALYREAYEELSFSAFNPIYLRTYLWESSKEKELVNVFAAVGDFRIGVANEEVSECRYWTMEEIVSSLGKGVFTPNFEHEFSMFKETLLSLL